MARVKCINSKGTKLVEGYIYEVSYTTTDTLSIKGGMSYDKTRFETLDGSDIKGFTVSINYHDDKTRIDKNDLGKWVVCRNDIGSKQLTSGQYYKVIDISIDKDYGRIENVKLEGIKGWITPWRFRKPDIKQRRTIKLKTMDGIEIKKPESTLRKFDKMSGDEQVKTMLTLMSRALDEKIKFGYNESISNMILKNNKYDLTQKDIDEFGELSLEKILNKK